MQILQESYELHSSLENLDSACKCLSIIIEMENVEKRETKVVHQKTPEIFVHVQHTLQNSHFRVLIREVLLRLRRCVSKEKRKEEMREKMKKCILWYLFSHLWQNLPDINSCSKTLIENYFVISLQQSHLLITKESWEVRTKCYFLPEGIFLHAWSHGQVISNSFCFFSLKLFEWVLKFACYWSVSTDVLENFQVMKNGTGK